MPYSVLSLTPASVIVYREFSYGHVLDLLRTLTEKELAGEDGLAVGDHPGKLAVAPPGIA